MPGKHLQATVAVLCLALQGCAFFTSKTPAATGDTIKIGLVGSFSQGNGGNGGRIQNSLNLLVPRINAVGLLGGKKIEIISGDDGSSDVMGAQVANDLIAKGAVALIGPNSSGIAKTMLLNAAKLKGVPMISPSATSPDFSDPSIIDGGGYFFRTVPSDTLQGKVLAKRASDLGYTKLAILHVNNPYGTAFSKVIAKNFEGTAGHTTIDIPFDDVSENAKLATYDFTTPLNKALDAKPSAIVMISYTGQGATIMNTFARLGRDASMPFIFTDATFDPEFTNGVTNKTVLDGKFGTAPYSDPAFHELYKSTYKIDADPGYDAGPAYDALALIALAIEAGKSATPASIKDNLRKVSGPTGDVVKPETIEAGLAKARAGQPVNYDGWSGPVELDEHGDIKSGKYGIWKVNAQGSPEQTNDPPLVP